MKGRKVKEDIEKEEMVKEEEGSFLTDRPRWWIGTEVNELRWKEMRTEQDQEEDTEEGEEALEVEGRGITGNTGMRWRGRAE